jgi:selenocysteine-specific elongation factor
MRYVIMGTAGHIDHGKSALVKALTGIDPDRLKEEKERGITIDLGFADLTYPDGLTIGIVDVPGHERLVRNMLAGAGGIDFVLMVIAADEGIMPQSREHLAICDLLRIKSGLVAVTKADLVEPDWLELVTGEVRDFVKGTFLDGAEIIPVSSVTGQNLEELKTAIGDVARKVEVKPSEGLFRLPVDRVFTLKGFGTVVTGTAVSGSASVDETLDILPGGLSTRIRGLQSHGKPVKRVYAGQRAALNLPGIEKEDLHRGDTLVSAGRLSPTRAIDARVELLKGAPALKNRGLVHFHLGTSETVARVILYETEQLKPGSAAYCQLRLQNPIVAQSGDRFIIRRFSPVDTIGGGEVLDPWPARRRKKDGIGDLEIFDSGAVARKVAMKVKKAAMGGMTVAYMEGWLRAELPAISRAIEELKAKGEIKKYGDVLIHAESSEKFKKIVIDRLEKFHRENPLKPGMSKEELRGALRMEPRIFAGMVSALSEVTVEKDLLRLRSFKAAASDEDKRRVLGLIEEKGFQPPDKKELALALKVDEKKLSGILGLLASEGSAVRINDSLYLGKAAFESMIALLREHYAGKPDMTVAEFRDLLCTTRKYALPYLEYLDSNNITMRVGDVRKLILK